MSKLFVICGHGAGDSGACGYGYTEAERVRVLGKRIKELGGSSVTLGDVNRDFYADKGINYLNLSSDTQIIELHMDSSSSSSAKGGHVIIKSGFNPDSYDNALAKFISGLFPGRSQSIVGRSDLANVNRAAAKNYGYRLVECGFISNANDLKIFNSNIDNMAIGILNCFGIKIQNGVSTSTSNTSNTSSSTSSTSTTQSSEYDEWVARLQKELNNQGFKDGSGNSLSVDGLAGPKTLQACPVVKKGAQGGITKLIQERIGVTADGIFGNDTENAVKQYQTNNGLSSDGVVGNNTWNSLLSKQSSRVYHVVKSGETLSSIARIYGTTYLKIAQLNGIANPNVIKVGQKLRVK